MYCFYSAVSGGEGIILILNDGRHGSGDPRSIIISILSKLKVRGSALYRL